MPVSNQALDTAPTPSTALVGCSRLTSEDWPQSTHSALVGSLLLHHARPPRPHTPMRSLRSAEIPGVGAVGFTVSFCPGLVTVLSFGNEAVQLLPSLRTCHMRCQVAQPVGAIQRCQLRPVTTTRREVVIDDLAVILLCALQFLCQEVGEAGMIQPPPQPRPPPPFGTGTCASVPGRSRLPRSGSRPKMRPIHAALTGSRATANMPITGL